MKVTMSDREGFAAFLLRCRARGLHDLDLLKAIETVPRRAFVASEHAGLAYRDRSIPIECGETLEGLDLQATMIAALGVTSGHRVLEIGTGSGYTAAVLGRLASRVTTVERFKTLANLAQQRLADLSIGNVVVRHDNALKLEPGQDGPFDRIIAWAAFDAVPRHYVDLLATQGILVAAIGPEEGVQTLAKLTKVGSRFEREDIGSVRFQLLSGFKPALL